MTKIKNEYFLKKYSEIDDTSICRKINIRLDNPKEGLKYLKIGADCIIQGNFIFESEQGSVIIGNHSYIGNSTFISRSSIVVGNNVTIAWGCTIYDHDSHSLSYLKRRTDISDELYDIRHGENFIKNKDWGDVATEPIVINDDSWIGMNCIILKGVVIGKGSIIGAGSVVTHDVPDFCVAAGNPAKVVKQLNK
ncbi:acyltransferase [Xylanibacter oryzae]|uniref:acyltransferase n=1 Tax=Xylanibacter oryzae TaxID=185293 RepID=UPI0004AE087F|nr:acyltransferase [Xylanibacter oryzae]